MQYGQQEKRLREMNSKTEQLEQKNQKLKMAENTQRIVTDGVILIAGVLMAAVCGHFAEQGTVSADQAMGRGDRNDQLLWSDGGTFRTFE